MDKLTCITIFGLDLVFESLTKEIQSFTLADLRNQIKSENENKLFYNNLGIRSFIQTPNFANMEDSDLYIMANLENQIKS